MLTSANLREAMEAVEQDSSASLACEELPEDSSSSTAAGGKAGLELLLASSNSQQKQKLSNIAAADAEGTSSAVASSVTKEELNTDQFGAVQPPLINCSSAEWPGNELPESQPPFSRPHLAAQIDDDLVPHSVLAADEAMAETVGLTNPSTAHDAIQSHVSMSGTIAVTPARHQSALQGATARNQAAIAAHRARLKEHSSAGSSRSAATRLGWAPPVVRTATPASPILLAPEHSNLRTGWQPRSSRTSTPAASRQSLTRFGSVATPSSLRSAQSLSPPGAPSAPLRRGWSVALPSPSSQVERRSLDLAQGRPLSPARGRSLSPTLQRGASVTIAEIMKQNSRLPPLDFVPPAPSNAGVALSRLLPLRRGSSAASPSAVSAALHRGSSVGSALLQGVSKVLTPGPAEGSSAISPRSSPQRWSEPPPGSVAQSLPRQESPTFSPRVRRDIELNLTDSVTPLVTDASGVHRSSNRCSQTPVLY